MHPHIWVWVAPSWCRISLLPLAKRCSAVVAKRSCWLSKCLREFCSFPYQRNKPAIIIRFKRMFFIRTKHNMLISLFVLLGFFWGCVCLFNLLCLWIWFQNTSILVSDFFIKELAYSLQPRNGRMNIIIKVASLSKERFAGQPLFRPKEYVMVVHFVKKTNLKTRMTVRFLKQDHKIIKD